MKTFGNNEVFHYHSNSISILSRNNIVDVRYGVGNVKIKLPITIFDIFSFSRLLRRLLRIDKCNVFLVIEKPLVLVIIRRGIVYHYDENNGLIKTLILKNCRNILHVDLCRLPNGSLAFGEYGSNNRRTVVPIYLSKDNGLSWFVPYEFPKNSIKHIHVIKYDVFTDTIWCCTGDNDGENKIVIFDHYFNVVDTIGDGSQLYRSCDLFFTRDKVVWLMDSPNEVAHVISYDRKHRRITIGQELMGPVWYSCSVGENIYLAATSVEPGYSMKHKTAHIMISNDLIEWRSLISYRKDIFPIDLFKFGVIAFPIGLAEPSAIYYFGEALSGLDGKIRKIDISEYNR
jgi:hypothetical protein